MIRKIKFRSSFDVALFTLFVLQLAATLEMFTFLSMANKI